VAVLPGPVVLGALGVVPGAVVLGVSVAGGAPVVPMPPAVEDGLGVVVDMPGIEVPAGGVLVVDGIPPTVELAGGVTGRPGLVRFTPGVLVPPTVLDGVPSVESVPVTPVPVPVVPTGGVDSVEPGLVPAADDGIDDDDELPAGGDICEMAGLRSLGMPGFGGGAVVTIGAAGLGRTRSPSGIPSKSAWLLDGRGPASTKSDATTSDAR